MKSNWLVVSKKKTLDSLYLFHHRSKSSITIHYNTKNICEMWLKIRQNSINWIQMVLSFGVCATNLTAWTLISRAKETDQTQLVKCGRAKRVNSTYLDSLIMCFRPHLFHEVHVHLNLTTKSVCSITWAMYVLPLLFFTWTS